MAYFLLAVSTRENVDLCMKHALAGFMDNINGLWTFLDIQVGDYVSFLYGAEIHNLYQVDEKVAYKEAHRLPPWPPLKFRSSKRLYHFPFRLKLTQVRALREKLVRSELSYVAENLLLRGGYRKTHFQADQTTLQNVSEMGFASSGSPEPLEMPDAETFIPLLVADRKASRLPEIAPLRELIVQTLLRTYLSDSKRLGPFLSAAGVHGVEAASLEVLGEKAFPEGHVDILIKEATPMGMGRKIVVEVKTGKATGADVRQLRLYMNRLGEECAGGVLVAREFGERMIKAATGQGIACVRYSLPGLAAAPQPYSEALRSLTLISVRAT